MVVIYKGDDTDFAGLQEIKISIKTKLDLAEYRGLFDFLGVERVFNKGDLTDKIVTVSYTADETEGFCLGQNYGTFTLWDEKGRRAAVCKILVSVVSHCLCAGMPENAVEISIENAYDYNKLENLPTINGVEVKGGRTGHDYHLQKIMPFSKEWTYAKGDQCIYGDVIYLCVRAIPEPKPWDGNDWLCISNGDRSVITVDELPAEGVPDAIYIVRGTGLIYTWDGEKFVALGRNHAPLRFWNGYDAADGGSGSGEDGYDSYDGAEEKTIPMSADGVAGLVKTADSVVSSAAQRKGTAASPAAVRAILAPEFDPQARYFAGQAVCHDGKYYVCVTKTAEGRTGEWDPADFAETTVDGVLAVLVEEAKKRERAIAEVKRDYDDLSYDTKEEVPVWRVSIEPASTPSDEATLYYDTNASVPGALEVWKGDSEGGQSVELGVNLQGGDSVVRFGTLVTTRFRLSAEAQDFDLTMGQYRLRGEKGTGKKVVSQDTIALMTDVEKAVEGVAAYYITSNAKGDAFETRADLENASVYYSGGRPRVPTRNDYAVVLADETHENQRWQYIYDGGEEDSSDSDGGEVRWRPQYAIETNRYEDLGGKPKINGHELEGDKSGTELGLQNELTFDDAPAEGSANPVKSGGIYSALDGKRGLTDLAVYEEVPYWEVSAGEGVPVRLPLVSERGNDRTYSDGDATGCYKIEESDYRATGGLFRVLAYLRSGSVWGILSNSPQTSAEIITETSTANETFRRKTEVIPGGDTLAKTSALDEKRGKYDFNVYEKRDEDQWQVTWNGETYALEPTTPTGTFTAMYLATGTRDGREFRIRIGFRNTGASMVQVYNITTDNTWYTLTTNPASFADAVGASWTATRLTHTFSGEKVEAHEEVVVGTIAKVSDIPTAVVEANASAIAEINQALDEILSEDGSSGDSEEESK